MSGMPALFVGHGNPMNALARNAYTEAWRSLGSQVPTPRVVLCISAHWYRPGTAVTAMERPRTLHDFGGFPQELFAVEYPAAGDPELALDVRRRLAPIDVRLDHEWGLDHGAWAVLCHLFPSADVPIVQLCIDEGLPAVAHYEIGRRLAALRDAGVLIVGSGNVVHNLHAYAWGRHDASPFDWEVRFEAQARECMLRGDHRPLVEYESLGRDAQLSVPTPEHFLPLLYVLGAARSDDAVSFPVEGVDGGSISMLAVRVG